ncbi:MAG: hypothetical protein EXR72_07870 [Myxococcales bacterium]|nr:hypothetical protein [Myxococcales bacterium]
MKPALRSLFFAVCAAAGLYPALAAGTLLSDRYDWRYFDAMVEISRRSVLWYHQVALWNPYSCGGEVALANPQSLDASPTFLLVLLFGTALGYKLAICLYHFCAMDGVFRLGRRFGLGAQGSTLAALGFGLSGYLGLHFSSGHATFVGVTLLPYLLLAYDRALDEIEYAVPAGMVAAWIALEGGTFTPPMAAELLLLWATMEAIKRRSVRPFVLLAACGGVALAVGAVRMFPVLEFIKDHPRPPFLRAADASGPWWIAWDLIAWREFGPVAGRKYWSHEYTARLPYVLLPLWALGIGWLAWSRRLSSPLRWSARRMWIVAIVGALLAMGNFWRFAPWSLLQKLPVMRDLRVPSRHLVLVTLGVSLLAGFAWDHCATRLAARWPGRRWAWLGAALCAFAAVDGAYFTAIQYRGVFTVAPARVDRPVPFHHVEGGWREMRDVFLLGHGSLQCDEVAPLQRADALDEGDVPQERLLDPGAGEVVASSWSPNRRVITVALQRPTTLLVNSNWNEHWSADRGLVTRVAGRLAVDLAALPPGRHVVTLRYAPRSFDLGLAVTLAMLPGLLLAFAYQRRRRATEPSAAPASPPPAPPASRPPVD